MPFEIPYVYRVLTLVVLMALLAVWDYRRRAASIKWREYLFVLAGGLLGGLMGLLNDLITSSISPEYFRLGKGLAGGPDLHTRAALLGLQAGFSAGAIAAAIFLYAATRGRARLAPSCRTFLHFALKPLACAIVCVCLFPLLFRRFDPLNVAGTLQPLLEPGRLSRFMLVWWIHSGLYTGLAAGLIWAIGRVPKQPL
jgi:hypothetical protein